MKTKLDLKSLQKSLKNLSKVVPNNPQLPVLSSILFEFDKGKLTLSATDLYLGIRTQLKIESDVKTSIAIPGQMFKDVVNSLDSDEITLEIAEKNIKVVSGSSRVSLPINPPDDYPEFPQIKNNEVSLSSEIIEEVGSLISFAASRDQVRPILTTIMFSFSQKGLEVVATDGFRLAVKKYPDLKFKTEQQFLMPIKAFEEIVRLVEQSEADKINLNISDELKQIKVILDKNEIYIRLVEGDYPPYEKILPESYKVEFQVSGEELRQEFHKAAIIAREASNIVRVQPDKKTLQIRSITTAMGEYSGELSLTREKENESDNLEVAFDIRYLLDFFSSVKPELVSVGVNDSLKPVGFKVPGLEDYVYVVMPFRVND